MLSSVYHFRTRDGSDFLTIDPSALPSGVGVTISDVRGNPPAGVKPLAAVGLVHASRSAPDDRHEKAGLG
jgi:hypothetical protein